jgi:hypothetical protein
MQRAFGSFLRALCQPSQFVALFFINDRPLATETALIDSDTESADTGRRLKEKKPPSQAKAETFIIFLPRDGGFDSI